MKLTEHMLELVEENLKLYKENQDLYRQIRPEIHVPILKDELHKDKVGFMVFRALSKQREELEKSIRRKKRILEERGNA